MARSMPAVTLTRMPFRAGKIDVFQQRTRYRSFGSFACTIFAGRRTGAHHGHAHLGHDGFHVGEIDVDQSGSSDQLGDTLHRTLQNFVRRAKCVQ